MESGAQRAVALARRGKHRAFVAYKRIRYPLSLRAEPGLRRAYRMRPYRYRAGDFAALGLGPRADTGAIRHDALDRVIYCFWTGDNDLTPNRVRSLESLRAMNEPAGVRVELVTPDTLARYVAPEHPLSEHYEHLHLVHRADYLRAYFLHFHGGGYADIKPPTSDWSAAFDRMDASPAWLMGDHKPSRYLSPAFDDRRLERLMRRTSPAHVHQIAIIARPRTPLSAQWWQLLNAKLDAVGDELARHPGRGRRGGPDYPVPWTGLLGQIIDPLTVKYADRVRHAPEMRLLQSDYL